MTRFVDLIKDAQDHFSDKPEKQEQLSDFEGAFLLYSYFDY